MIKRETMKHRPGATKRREKVERMERERFLKNLADMTEIETKGMSNGSTERAVDQGSASNRWAALRNFSHITDNGTATSLSKIAVPKPVT
jgi:ribosome biogenesis protein SLX9